MLIIPGFATIDTGYYQLSPSNDYLQIRNPDAAVIEELEASASDFLYCPADRLLWEGEGEGHGLYRSWIKKNLFVLRTMNTRGHMMLATEVLKLPYPAVRPTYKDFKKEFSRPYSRVIGPWPTNGAIEPLQIVKRVVNPRAGFSLRVCFKKSIHQIPATKVPQDYYIHVFYNGHWCTSRLVSHSVLQDSAGDHCEIFDGIHIGGGLKKIWVLNQDRGPKTTPAERTDEAMHTKLDQRLAAVNRKLEESLMSTTFQPLGRFYDPFCSMMKLPTPERATEHPDREAGVIDFIIVGGHLPISHRPPRARATSGSDVVDNLNASISGTHEPTASALPKTTAKASRIDKIQSLQPPMQNTSLQTECTTEAPCNALERQIGDGAVATAVDSTNGHKLDQDTETVRTGYQCWQRWNSMYSLPNNPLFPPGTHMTQGFEDLVRSTQAQRLLQAQQTQQAQRDQQIQQSQNAENPPDTQQTQQPQDNENTQTTKQPCDLHEGANTPGGSVRDLNDGISDNGYAAGDESEAQSTTSSSRPRTKSAPGGSVQQNLVPQRNINAIPDLSVDGTRATVQGLYSENLRNHQLHSQPLSSRIVGWLASMPRMGSWVHDASIRRVYAIAPVNTAARSPIDTPVPITSQASDGSQSHDSDETEIFDSPAQNLVSYYHTASRSNQAQPTRSVSSIAQFPKQDPRLVSPQPYQIDPSSDSETDSTFSGSFELPAPPPPPLSPTPSSPLNSLTPFPPLQPMTFGAWGQHTTDEEQDGSMEHWVEDYDDPQSSPGPVRPPPPPSRCETSPPSQSETEFRTAFEARIRDGVQMPEATESRATESDPMELDAMDYEVFVPEAIDNTLSDFRVTFDSDAGSPYESFAESDHSIMSGISTHAASSSLPCSDHSALASISSIHSRSKSPSGFENECRTNTDTEREDDSSSGAESQSNSDSDPDAAISDELLGLHDFSSMTVEASTRANSSTDEFDSADSTPPEGFRSTPPKKKTQRGKWPSYTIEWSDEDYSSTDIDSEHAGQYAEERRGYREVKITRSEKPRLPPPPPTGKRSYVKSKGHGVPVKKYPYIEFLEWRTIKHYNWRRQGATGRDVARWIKNQYLWSIGRKRILRPSHRIKSRARRAEATARRGNPARTYAPRKTDLIEITDSEVTESTSENETGVNVTSGGETGNDAASEGDSSSDETGDDDKIGNDKTGVEDKKGKKKRSAWEAFLQEHDDKNEYLQKNCTISVSDDMVRPCKEDLLYDDFVSTEMTLMVRYIYG